MHQNIARHFGTSYRYFHIREGAIPDVLKRQCSGLCKKFRVIRPAGTGRYRAGQALCQICQVWIDHKGCHLKDGSRASASSVGWYCNCCKYKVRRHPRNRKYKENLRVGTENRAVAAKTDIGEMDMEYFNNNRASILCRVASVLPEDRAALQENNPLYSDPEMQNAAMEYNCPVSKIVELAYADSPNQISLIVEFEWLKSRLNRVPTEDDIKKHSRFGIRQFRSEFGELGHMLNRLGYDPWYRDAGKKQEGTPKGARARTHIRKKKNIVEDINKLNRVIGGAIDLLKSSDDGIYTDDLRKIFRIRINDMPDVVKRIVRVDGMRQKKPRGSSGTLLYYVQGRRTGRLGTRKTAGKKAAPKGRSGRRKGTQKGRRKS